MKGEGMISIDRENGYIVLSRCEYLYRNGERDEVANSKIGDGDIIIPLPQHMIDTTHDHSGSTDGLDAVLIIDEIRKCIREEQG